MANVVVILGAGSSADFDLPLGGTLLDLATKRLTDFHTKWMRHTNQRGGLGSLEGLRQIMRRDEFDTQLLDHCTNYDNGRETASLENVKEILEFVKKAPVYSIDTLALENPDIEDICRWLTADILVRSVKNLDDSPEDTSPQWRFLNRNLADGSANWLHLFCSMCRNRITKGDALEVDVISFNYDRIAEYGLRKIWELPTREFIDFDEVFRFHYPHGFIDWEVHKEHARPSSASEEIIFAHNKMENTSFQSSRVALSDSQEVISLGFHFAPENTASLGLNGDIVIDSLVYQNFDSNRGLRDRVNELSVGSSRAFSGSISRAIFQGELGSLPS